MQQAYPVSVWLELFSIIRRSIAASKHRSIPESYSVEVLLGKTFHESKLLQCRVICDPEFCWPSEVISNFISDSLQLGCSKTAWKYLMPTLFPKSKTFCKVFSGICPFMSVDLTIFQHANTKREKGRGKKREPRRGAGERGKKSQKILSFVSVTNCVPSHLPKFVAR